jgi:hypothetical protein
LIFSPTARRHAVLSNKAKNSINKFILTVDPRYVKNAKPLHHKVALMKIQKNRDDCDRNKIDPKDRKYLRMADDMQNSTRKAMRE